MGEQGEGQKRPGGYGERGSGKPWGGKGRATMCLHLLVQGGSKKLCPLGHAAVPSCMKFSPWPDIMDNWQEKFFGWLVTKQL